MEFHEHNVNWYNGRHGSSAEKPLNGQIRFIDEPFIGDLSAEILVDEIFGRARL